MEERIVTNFSAQNQQMYRDLQLVYVYIESSYGGVSDFELQLGNKTNIYFAKKEDKSENFEEEYYFCSQPRFEYKELEDEFFDTKGRVKRLDILVGKNGSGKTTILNTLAGYGILGKWIEIYYSEKEDKYFHYSSGNAYKSINTAYNKTVSVFLDDVKICPLEIKLRKVFLWTNDYESSFVWKSDDGLYNGMLMRSDFSSIGEFLFSKEKSKKTLFNDINTLYFRLEFGLLADENDTNSAIELRQKLINFLDNGNVDAALDTLIYMLGTTFCLLKSINDEQNVLSRAKTADKLDGLKNAIEQIIKTVRVIHNKNVKISSTKNESSYMTTKIQNMNMLMVSLDISIEAKYKSDFDELFKETDTVVQKNKSGIGDSRFISFSAGFSGMSSGEKAYLELYSNMYKILNENACEERILLLLFDEPEAYMHPEWSRQMVDRMTGLVTELYDTHEEWKSTCQIIITTHTPYLLSDLLPCFVHRVERKDGKTEVSEGAECFAANLYDILDSNFFISNPIGDFALHKLNKILNESSATIDEKEVLNMKAIVDEIQDFNIKRIMKEKLRTVRNDKS